MRNPSSSVEIAWRAHMSSCIGDSCCKWGTYSGLLLRNRMRGQCPSQAVMLKQLTGPAINAQAETENCPLRSLGLPRGFSAPVKLRYKYSDEELAFLMKHDTDSFNRWEAGQQVGCLGIAHCFLRSDQCRGGSISPSSCSSKLDPYAAERLASGAVDVPMQHLAGEFGSSSSSCVVVSRCQSWWCRGCGPP